MARSKTPAGQINLNLTNLPMIPCDDVDVLESGDISVTQGETTFVLAAGTAACGKDAEGAWYASASAVKIESFPVSAVERDEKGNLIASHGEEAFVYVPHSYASIVQLEGDLPIEEITNEEEAEGEAEEAAAEEAPAPRRQRAAAAAPAKRGQQRRGR